MYIATAEQMRRMDQVAIRERGISSVILMETAARAVADEALKLLPEPEDSRAAVFCGYGNNGGDGLAAARFLHEAGVTVRVFFVGDRNKMTEDASEMQRKLESASVTPEDFGAGSEQTSWCRQCHIMIDAIFGTGLRSKVIGTAADAIALMNQSPAYVISADIPSGVHADTGEVQGIAVYADKTVTFTLPKLGHFLGEGGICSGEVIVSPIGIPEDLVNREEYPAICTDPFYLPARKRDTHKGHYGKVLIFAGSKGYTGAPAFAANAATRSGAGLVFLTVPEEIYSIEAVKCDEVIVTPLPIQNDSVLDKAETCSAVLVGPGLGNSPRAKELTFTLIEGLTRPLILDADGINILSLHIDSLDKREGITVLTPHDGEFARLNGGEPVGGNRLETARQFAVKHRCVLVLKGYRTITAFPDGTCFINASGNPGMAKGGSGDILAGMIASFIGQGLPLKEAVPAAVYLHGRAGDLCARQFGEYGMTPSDMLKAIPSAIMNPI